VEMKTDGNQQPIGTSKTDYQISLTEDSFKDLKRILRAIMLRFHIGLNFKQSLVV
jgi:hypothetical protein